MLMLFLMFFLGIVDFARMLWTWGAANEATRLGARIAVVCDNTFAMKNLVVSRMQTYLPQLTSTNVSLEWFGVSGSVSGTCTNTLGTPLASQCIGVRVSITGLNYQWISPLYFANYTGTITMPSFATYLPVEIMGQDPNSSSVCS